MNHVSEPRHADPPRGFTDKQGQYLAFIHAYTLVMGQPPAEADLQRHFGVTPPSVHGMVLSLERAGLIRRHTPPSVHGMVLSLERAGLIRRQPRRARSITILVEINDLPPLRPRQANQSKPL